MSTRTTLTGSFTFQSWDEKPYSEPEGGVRTTHALVVNAFKGEIEGTGTCAYLLMYASESEGVCHGYEQVVGTVAGRSGSFVLEHSGTFEGETVHTRWTVVPGSGRGGLSGIGGAGGFTARHGKPSTPYTLDIGFDDAGPPAA